MADFEATRGQDLADQQVVPVVFRWLGDNIVGDFEQPGVWTPFSAGPNGAVFVSIAGGTNLNGAFLDDDSDGVAPTADNDRLAVVARGYVYDPAGDEFNRWRAGDDNTESVAPSATVNTGVVSTRPRLYQGTTNTYIRARANDNITVLASAARTATVASATFNNGNYRGGQFIINTTVVPGAAPSTVFNVQMLNGVTGNFITLLSSVAITAVGTVVLRVYPGLVAAANLVANDLLPWQWRVQAVHGNANSVTYSVAANLML